MCVARREGHWLSSSTVRYVCKPQSLFWALREGFPRTRTRNACFSRLIKLLFCMLFVKAHKSGGLDRGDVGYGTAAPSPDWGRPKSTLFHVIEGCVCHDTFLLQQPSAAAHENPKCILAVCVERERNVLAGLGGRGDTDSIKMSF